MQHLVPYINWLETSVYFCKYYSLHDCIKSHESVTGIEKTWNKAVASAAELVKI